MVTILIIKNNLKPKINKLFNKILCPQGRNLILRKIYSETKTTETRKEEFRLVTFKFKLFLIFKVKFLKKRLNKPTKLITKIIKIIINKIIVKMLSIS